MLSRNILLKWTTKTKLSSKIQDPLGMYILKFLEDYFLPGITTQTHRLRYFSFLTWAWKIIADKKLKWDKILNMEKILTLIAASHHFNDLNSPIGIRNKRDAEDFLRYHRIIDVNKFTKFGRNNKEGYGNFYYKGPLKTLRIFWREDDTIRFSSIGKKIAKLIDNIDPLAKVIFLKEKLSKKEVLRLHPFCLCARKILAKESKIWRMVFFGFTKLTADGSLEIDVDSYKKFEKKEIEFPPTLRIPPDLSEEVSFGVDKEAIYETLLSKDYQVMTERNICRRYTLFLLMKIIAEAEPEIGMLNQTIRDAIYFKQVYTRNGNLVTIDFGKLEKIRRLWEVYIHNLYYISVFEFTFHILLEKIKERPLGITLKDIILSFNIRKIEKSLEKWGVALKERDPEIAWVEDEVKSLLDGKKTNLEKIINERKLFLNFFELTSFEEKIANLLLLLLLLKHRYESFCRDQLKILSYREEGLFSMKPSYIYDELLQGRISDFLTNIFSLVKNRHKYVASMKYYYFGTKSWLFTEENDHLYYYDYGRSYRPSKYREAKWRNVTELLLDMKLLRKSGKRLSLSKMGYEWLKKII